MISINSIAVLIFASSIIQNEACTKPLRRMNAMRGPSAPQQGPLASLQGPSTPQQGPLTSLQGSLAPQRGPSTLQTPPTSRISTAMPATPTTISRSYAANYPNDVDFGSNPPRDAVTAESLSPLDFASTRDWIPDDPQDETSPNARPLSSILNSRRFNLASQPPSPLRDNAANSFYDMSASDETDPANSETRSVTSALPDLVSSGLSNLAPSLSSLVSKLPDASQVTPSLRDTTSSLSRLTPDVSGMTSSMSNIPNQVTSGVSSLLPTNLFPSSSMSSIPGLMYLVSSLFSNWNGENNARSSNSDAAGNSMYSLLPGIMSAATSLVPLLSNLGATSANRSPPSALANPLSFLPTSLFGNPSGDNVKPDRYDMDEPIRREKSRYRSKRRGNRRNNPDYDMMNEYSDERDGYKNGPQDYRYQYDYSSSPNGRGGYQQSSRGDGNRFQYRYQYNPPQ